MCIPCKEMTYLDEAIQSIENAAEHALCRVKILIGVDGNIRTWQIVQKRYKQKAQYALYFFPDSPGPYMIRNTLAFIASTEYLCFFDSDDIMAISNIKKALALCHVYDIVRWRYTQFDAHTTFQETRRSRTIGSEGQFIIKRSVFIKHHGFFCWPCASDTEFEKRMRHNRVSSAICDGFFKKRLHLKCMTMDPSTGYLSELRKNIRHDLLKTQREKGFPDPMSLSTAMYKDTQQV